MGDIGQGEPDEQHNEIERYGDEEGLHRGCGHEDVDEKARGQQEHDDAPKLHEVEGSLQGEHVHQHKGAERKLASALAEEERQGVEHPMGRLQREHGAIGYAEYREDEYDFPKCSYVSGFEENRRRRGFQRHAQRSIAEESR